MSRNWTCGLPLLLLLAPTASAQWSPDPTQNTAVADGAGEQVECQIVPRADGGCYISWFDAPSAYDVKLQQLDADGREQWVHDGITVADRDLSWVQDYGLDVDAAGRAVLAYRDEDATTTAIFLNIVQPDGTLPFGTDGLMVDNSSVAFLAAPEVAATTDGDYVVAWTRDSQAVLQKYDLSGSPVWPAEVVLSDPGGDDLSVSDLKAADGGGVIVSLISEVFMSHRHLRAQKLDTDGNPLWGAVPPLIYEAGSLQMGNFPEFVSDGSGGAVLSWYQAASHLQSYVQHLRPDGSEAFAHNGVPVSTSMTRQRVSPDAVYNRNTDEVFVFWVEEDLGQSQRGVYGQKLDATGARQWTDQGLMVQPVDDTISGFVRALPYADGAYVLFLEDQGGGPVLGLGVRVDGDGNLVCASGVTPFSSAASGKGDLVAALNSQGMALAAWEDERGGGDIYAQNFNPDCSLGPVAPDYHLYRGTPADLLPGWQALALPLDSTNDNETPPFPVVVSPGGSETDDISSTEPLVLYRMLGPGDTHQGNILRARKAAGAVELNF
jgi:hypothetical protein